MLDKTAEEKLTWLAGPNMKTIIMLRITTGCTCEHGVCSSEYVWSTPYVCMYIIHTVQSMHAEQSQTQKIFTPAYVLSEESKSAEDFLNMIATIFLHYNQYKMAIGEPALWT